jgi:hypothetical protein
MDFSIKRGAHKPVGAASYEVALRVIGQDLTPLFVESVDITVEGETFVAQAWCIGAGEKKTPDETEGFFRGIGRSLGVGGKKTGRASEAARNLSVLRYGPQDLIRLDELGSTRQTHGEKTPDASSLAESLRNVGRVVDSKGGRFISLSKDRRKVAFVYEDENGNPQREELYSLSLHQAQQEALSLRGTKRDRWEDSKG